MLRFRAKQTDNSSLGELQLLLAPWCRRLRFQYLGNLALWGFAIGVGLVFLLFFFERFVVLEVLPLTVAVAVLGPLLLVTAVGVVSAPRGLAVFRTLDRRGQLRDRLSTAYELAGSESAMAKRQRSDAIQQFSLLQPPVVLPYHLPIRATAIAVAFSIAVVALAFLPNPMRDRLQQEKSERRQIAQSLAQVENVKKDLLGPESPLTKAEREKLEQALTEMERKLAESANAKEALAALSAGQDAIRRSVNTKPGDIDKSINAAAQALTKDPLTSDLGKALLVGDTATVEESTKNLVDRLAQLDGEQKKRVAQSLQEAANAASGSQMSGQLRELARSLAGSDATDLAEKVGELEKAIEDTLAESGRQQAMAQALQDIDSAKRAFSSQEGNDGRPLASSQQSGEGEQRAPGDGNRTSLNGGGGNSSQGDGQGGNRGGSEGGIGDGAKSGGENPRLDLENPEKVYVVGREGAGPSTQMTSGDGVIQGEIRPYREVIGEYARTARENVDRSALPPAMKDTVREYFSQLNK